MTFNLSVEMKILALDTSTKYLSLTISGGEKILAEHKRLADRKQESLIVKGVDDILRKARLSLRDIDCFAIGTGPGSFTGLRIGIAAVKGFSVALSKPVIAIPSYDAIAYSVFSENSCVKNGRDVIIMGDAKKEKVYAAIYTYRSGVLKKRTDYLLIKPHDFIKTIKRPAFISGDGIAVYGGLFKGAKEDMVQFLPERFWYPRSRVIAELALGMLKKKKTISSDKLVPMYLHSDKCDII